jgi:hypothetical protein
MRWMQWREHFSQSVCTLKTAKSQNFVHPSIDPANVKLFLLKS